jgi:hypothetical protein
MAQKFVGCERAGLRVRRRSGERHILFSKVKFREEKERRRKQLPLPRDVGGAAPPGGPAGGPSEPIIRGIIAVKNDDHDPGALRGTEGDKLEPEKNRL